MREYGGEADTITAEGRNTCYSGQSIMRSIMCERMAALILSFIILAATPACNPHVSHYERQCSRRILDIERDKPPVEVGRLLPPNQPLTLQQVLAIALENNPQLKAQAFDTRIAEEGINVARGYFFPRLQTSTTAYLLDEPIAFSLPGGREEVLISQFFYVVEAQLQQMIWDFGRSLGRYRQVENLIRISELTYRRARQSLVLVTTEAYFRLLRAQRNMKIAQEGLSAAKLQLKTARALYEQDLVAKDDVLRAQVQVSQFQLEVISTRNLIELARSSLNKYMGIGVHYRTEICDVVERPEFDHSLHDALQIAVDNRPEFQQIPASIAFEEAGLTMARAAFLPEVYGGGSYVYVGDPAVDDPNIFIAEAGIRLQIFSGGADLARYRQAKLKVSRAIVAANDICDTIALQVKQAMLSLEDAQERIDVASTAVRQAEENLKIVQNKYQQNLATPTQVADSQAVLVQSRQNYYAALYDLQIALARLRFATGVNDTGIRESKDIPAIERHEDK